MHLQPNFDKRKTLKCILPIFYFLNLQTGQYHVALMYDIKTGKLIRNTPNCQYNGSYKYYQLSCFVPCLPTECQGQYSNLTKAGKCLKLLVVILIWYYQQR